jgi:hypothetical protein
MSPPALSALLDPTSACELRDLRLLECGLTDEHLAVLADAPGARRVESLHLSQYQGITPAAAEALFASKNLSSLVSLRLGNPFIWPVAVSSLTAAPAWDGLRHLNLDGGGITAGALARLLESRTVRGLVRFGFASDSDTAFSPSADLIDRIGQLPHLARLTMSVPDVADDVRGQLARLRSRVWSTIQCYNREAEYDVHPNEVPPLDEDLEELDRWS